MFMGDPCDQSGQRAFAGTVLSDNRDSFTSSNLKKGNLKRVCLAFVSKFNRQEFQPPIVRRKRNAYGRISDGWSQCAHALQLANAGKRSLRPRIELCCSGQRLKELSDE